MATKKQEIKRLIRKDYGHPVLQRLLAELVYETRDFNKKDLNKRYNSLLEILLGSPRKEIKKDGYKHDTELLIRAAVMTKACFRKDPKTGKRLDRFLKPNEACNELARLEHINGYKFQTQLPEKTHPDKMAEIKATRERLMGKIEGKVDYYARQNFQYGLKQAFEYEETEKEIEFIETLIPDWLRRFGSQVRFEEK